MLTRTFEGMRGSDRPREQKAVLQHPFCDLESAMDALHH